ncbi:TrmH family RNA methyltransferase [Mobiluncus mulieris]|uniref:RNA methyltransferase, TrmH family n=2 Tax=Mobiluncus mulieris TaxID=2052 RepID=E0QMI8_9ACTO|nr:RNA methyltransferase [Mobiluncus mulieris]EEZ92313.1 RNA methyltransferase, TrmH family [Mobiluncus mulieris 28-1]EFM47242.1 RNA methyltransferase, TrmH family [Mobiluncus mulieris ATCC 35239]MBB5847384.1 tRNA G18 (ribose-2'-O)-methylase SpoU [Mobiluncus mulieris]MCU9969057.1 RNA methyltransferase [Mobiluncus mulieris]MCU9971522.1 RNA methyltransferase [Mobiluncus mulieris]
MQETNYSDEESEVGVGPWPTDQPLPMGDCYDAALLREGDRRNVPDRFRYWSNAAITAQLDWELNPHPEDLSAPCLEIAVENIGHDFNIGSIIRTANGLGVRQVHILGRRRFNRRGAMVTDRYLHLQFHEVPAALATYAAEKALTIVGMDNLPGAENLESCELPRRCLMIFGEESSGITPATQEILDRLIQIAQYGSTRSLNVGHAAAISMWAWVRAYPRRLP